MDEQKTQPVEISAAEMEEYKRIESKIIASMLRDKLFLPFALELMNYEVVYSTRLPLPAPACTDFDKIYINPKHKFFEESHNTKNRYSYSNNDGKNFLRAMTFCFAHEICHPMLFHDQRMKYREPELWNISGDFVINLLLKHIEDEATGKVKTKLVDMKVDQIDDICYDTDFGNMLEEEVYDDLKKKKKFQKKISYLDYDEFMKYISGDSDTKPQSGDQPGTGKIKITETSFDHKGKKSNHTTIEFPKLNGNATQDQKEKAGRKNKRLEMTRKMLESALTKGVDSADLKKFLGRLFKVKIDWEKIVKDSIMTALEKSDHETWGMPNEIWLANPHLPYLTTTSNIEVPGLAVVSIDESGSMGDPDVAKAVSIALDSWEHYKALLVVKHDYDVGWHKIYTEKPTKEEVKELSERKKCGGTSHKDVFNFINKFMMENSEYETVSVFIGITDLYSDIEHCQKILSMNVPRVWIANSNHVVRGLIGRVIRLK